MPRESEACRGLRFLAENAGMPIQPADIKLQGATNFRDLGGYTNESGRVVRHGRLFRSDHLGALTADDLAALDTALGPALRVCDLRGVQERQAAACVVRHATVHSLPIEPSVVQKLTSLMALGQTPTAHMTVALMQDTYRDFVRGNTPRFAALFGHLLDESTDAPLVFHCTAGKDRTGFAAALVLTALGVPREVVMDDFLLTNERLRPGTGSSHALPAEIVSVLYRVQQEFLHAALEAVDEDYGGLQAYLERGMGLGVAERARLHRLYLA